MKAVWAALMVGLLACVPGCRSPSPGTGKGDDSKAKAVPAKQHDLIVGTWDSTDGKAKRTLEFGKDGSLTIQQEGQPDMRGTYRFSGEATVELEFTRPRGEKVQEPMAVKVSPNELALTDREKAVHQYQRRP